MQSTTTPAIDSKSSVEVWKKVKAIFDAVHDPGEGDVILKGAHAVDGETRIDESGAGSGAMIRSSLMPQVFVIFLTLMM